MAGYASVMGMIFSGFSEIDLTVNHMKHLHGELLEYPTKDGRLRGHYKTHPNHVAVFVVVFLAIHPFQDGNGRLSRILTTLLLLRTDYDYVPYSSLESVIERSKDAYYKGGAGTAGA